MIKVAELSKRYKNGRGVWDIIFEVNSGQIFGFLGPNGSGKTTTFKIIVGLLKKDSGLVEICGHNIDNEFEKAMATVGCMFESIVHYNNMTAYENLRQVSRYYSHINKIQIEAMLDLVGLTDFQKERVSKFSLGMRQRLGIAAAMYKEPKVLILDEPFNGLDIQGIIELRQVIADLAAEKGTTVIISSHMATEMEKTCTHVGVIKEGILINVDEVSKVLEVNPSLEQYFVNQINLIKRGRE